MKPFDLSGKVAVVNGASRGIGEAIARGLADCGALVVLTSRSQESVQEVADDIVNRVDKQWQRPVMPGISIKSSHCLSSLGVSSDVSIS